MWYLYQTLRNVGGGNRSRALGGPGGQYTAEHPTPGKLAFTINGDLDIGDINLADMDPEVIRVSSAERKGSCAPVCAL